MSMERREVKTTKIVKSGRTSSQQNLSEFDNNLDHLLEDLQNTVSRPGSSLGNAYTTESRTVHYESSKGDGTHGRVQHLHAANPTVTVTENVSYKPGGGKSVTTYKTESYSTYNSGSDVPDNVRMQNNINKLDTLLDDLKQVRQGTLEKTDHGHTEMKLLYNDKITDERRTRSGSISREIELNAEGTYGKPLRQPSPARSGQVTRQVHEYKYVDQAKTIPSTDIVTVDNALNPAVLANLDPSLMPSPNTKVTTTIKTYTYEIPGTGYPQSMSPKLSETVFSSNPSTPSKSFSYNKIENHSSHNVSSSYPGDYVRPPSPQPVGWKKQMEVSSSRHVTHDTYGKPSPTPVRSNKENYFETRTTENFTNGYPSPTPNVKNINVYRETTSTKNINRDNYPINGYPNNNYPGSVNKTYIINESHTSRNVNQYGPNGYPPNTDFHKEIHTTNYPPKSMTETFDPKHGPGYPKEPRDVNITYKYTTHHHTSNSYKGHPHDEMDPLLHTPPFPTDSNDGPEVKGPPKKLDELMAEFGNGPPNNQYNAGYNARQVEIAQQKKEAKEVREEVQKKDYKDMPKTRNVAGPPVYYPPNVEMFTQKEESGGYKAEGGMMKESEKYKYEASSKSKSKGSSGVAVVPVCLPLCCGLPCAIL